MGSFYSSVTGKTIFNRIHFERDLLSSHVLNIKYKKDFVYLPLINFKNLLEFPNLINLDQVVVAKDMIITNHVPQSVGDCSAILKDWELVASQRKDKIRVGDFPAYLKEFNGNNSLEKLLLSQRGAFFKSFFTRYFEKKSRNGVIW